MGQEASHPTLIWEDNQIIKTSEKKAQEKALDHIKFVAQYGWSREVCLKILMKEDGLWESWSHYYLTICGGIVKCWRDYVEKGTKETAAYSFLLVNPPSSPNPVQITIGDAGEDKFFVKNGTRKYLFFCHDKDKWKSIFQKASIIPTGGIHGKFLNPQKGEDDEGAEIELKDELTAFYNNALNLCVQKGYIHGFGWNEPLNVWVLAWAGHREGFVLRTLVFDKGNIFVYENADDKKRKRNSIGWMTISKITPEVPEVPTASQILAFKDNDANKILLIQTFSKQNRDRWRWVIQESKRLGENRTYKTPEDSQPNPGNVRVMTVTKQMKRLWNDFTKSDADYLLSYYENYENVAMK